MQILVVYSTRTGNTRTLAEAVARGVTSTGAEGLLRAAGEVTKDDFVASAGVIAGSPVYFGGMTADLKQVFDDFVGIRRRMEGKVGAAFATYNTPAGGAETTILSILQAMLIYGMVIAGDPMDATGHYGVACKGTPDATALDHAEKLGRRVARLAEKLRAG